MKLRNSLKLKALKLNKIIDNENKLKNNNLKNSLYNSFPTNIYTSKNENIFKKEYDTNIVEIKENMNNNKIPYKYNNYIVYKNNNNSGLLNLKKINNSNETFDNNHMGTKCFSVPQTLNYYGRYNIKRKAANAVMKLNKLLLKNNINHLSLPKNSSINISVKKNKNNKNKYKSNYMLKERGVVNLKKMNVLFNENKYNQFFIDDLNNNKKKKISLFEKEKQRIKQRYNKILMDKFVELEACEKKFNVVIEDTLLKLNNEEKNLYNL